MSRTDYCKIGPDSDVEVWEEDGKIQIDAQDSDVFDRNNSPLDAYDRLVVMRSKGTKVPDDVMDRVLGLSVLDQLKPHRRFHILVQQLADSKLQGLAFGIKNGALEAAFLAGYEASRKPDPRAPRGHSSHDAYQAYQRWKHTGLSR